MKDPLKGLIISTSGHLRSSISTDQVKKWVEANGGKYSSSVTGETTHLICSEQHWQKKTAPVQAAQRNKNTKIVTYDWLEDSLQAQSKKREGVYLHHKIEHERKKKQLDTKTKEKRSVKNDAIEFKKGCQSAKTDLMSGTSLGHDILLAREQKASAVKAAIAEYKRTKRETEKAAAAAASAKAAYEAFSPMPQSSSTTPAPRTPSPSHDGERSATPASSPGTLREPSASLPETPSTPVSTVKSSTLRSPKTNTTIPDIDAHHLARDPSTGTPLRAVLHRVHFASNTNTRLILSLYESHLTPHTYAVHLRTSASNLLPVGQIIVPIGSDFASAWKVFRDVFFEKSRLVWEERENGRPDVWSKEYVEGMGGVEGLVRMGACKGEGDERVWPFRYVVRKED